MRALGNVAATVWIFGTALFFFVRFTSVFHHANNGAIDQALDRLFHYLGLSP